MTLIPLYSEGGLAIHADPTFQLRDTVLVSFAGVKSGSGLGTKSEFRSLLSEIGVLDRSLFVSEVRASWYQSLSPRAVSALESLLPREVGLIGNSMGGSGALLLAHLLTGRKIRVLAFNPQFSVFRSWCPWEKRFRKQTRRVWRRPHPTVLHPLPSSCRTDKADHECKVLVGEGNALDVLHGEEILKRAQCCEVVLCPGDHGLVRDLRDSGKLETLIREFVF